MLQSTIPHSCVEFRCAVQSSALCDGVYRMHEGSTGTVVAHFSIGLTEHRHRQFGAVRPSRDRRGRRQDNVRSVVPDLHLSSSAGVDFLCQMTPVSVPAPCVSTVGLPLIDALRAACGPCHESRMSTVGFGVLWRRDTAAGTSSRRTFELWARHLLTPKDMRKRT